ncbi:MAG TPA: agmatine deiminase family protein [Streptosporangiaceae bacterium]
MKPELGKCGSSARVLPRRAVLACAAAAASGAVAAGCGGAPVPDDGEAAGAQVQRGGDGTPRSAGWFAPADHVRHSRTWMAWPARTDIWGAMLAGVRGDVASVARAIARFEPVAMVARPDQAREAAAACGKGVAIVPLVNDDLWMRDMGPVFLINGRGGLAGLDMNFNGWGNKQVHPDDARIARKILALLGVPRFTAPFVAEGGALEVDGQGTVMATESSIINPNRNPGRSKAQLTAAICGYLGARTMIWVPGLRGHDITDDHIDGLARFTRPGEVIVDQPADPDATNVWAVSERQALTILRQSKDASGRLLRCRISRESATIPPHENPALFVNVYVNWYVCNGAVLIPRFGDRPADDAARSLVAGLYPGREIVQLTIDNLAEGGGGIHCVTQQQPAV